MPIGGVPKNSCFTDRNVTWMSANGLHLCNWTVALIQVTLNHLKVGQRRCPGLLANNLDWPGPKMHVNGKMKSSGALLYIFAALTSIEFWAKIPPKYGHRLSDFQERHLYEWRTTLLLYMLWLYYGWIWQQMCTYISEKMDKQKDGNAWLNTHPDCYRRVSSSCYGNWLRVQYKLAAMCCWRFLKVFLLKQLKEVMM